MDRRRFLLALGAGAMAGAWRGDAASRPPSASDELCRAPRAVPIVVTARGAGELHYQGTHILAYGALRELAQAYAAVGGGLAVAGGGCDDGVAAVRRGTADLGGLCCPVAGSRAAGLLQVLVARDPKAVVAHPNCPLTGLSLRALRAVARGEISDWQELGGPARPIAQVIRRHCPDYAEPVRTALVGAGRWSEKALFVDTDEQVVDLVARFPAALGVVSWVFARPLVREGRLKLLSLEGRRPDRERQRYPLQGPLHLVFRRWDEERMRPFFDFLYGRQGRAILARDLLPVTAEEGGYRLERFRLTA